MKWNWLTEGFDATSTTVCISRSQLLQTTHEAMPSPNNGMFIWSQAAPDVITYPDLVRGVWGKLDGAGNRNGLFYYHDGITWQPWKIELGTLNGDLFINHSIGIEKLDVGVGIPNQIIAVNSAADEFYFTFVASLIPDSGLDLGKLNNAPGPGYVPYSQVTGVYDHAKLVDIFTAFNNALTELPVLKLKDVTTAGVSGQVPAIAVPGGFLTLQFADQLIRDHTLPTNKLVYNPANNLKYARQNAGGTDLEFVDLPAGAVYSVKVASLRYGDSATWITGQVCNAGGGAAGLATTVSWTGAMTNDPDGLIVLTANRFKFTSTGKYNVRFTVPVHMVSVNVGFSQATSMQFRNVTAALILDSFVFSEDGPGFKGRTVAMECIITVANTTDDYEFTAVVAGNGSLILSGDAALGAVQFVAPTYHQHASITKLS